MKKKILLIVGICLLLAGGGFASGKYSTKGEREDLKSKIILPIISSCTHLAEAKTLRYLATNKKQDAAAAFQKIESCETIVDESKTYFTHTPEKIDRIESLQDLLSHYKLHIVEMIKQEYQIHGLLSLYVNKETSVAQKKQAQETLNILLGDQNKSIERSQIFINSIDEILMELW